MQTACTKRSVILLVVLATAAVGADPQVVPLPGVSGALILHGGGALSDDAVQTLRGLLKETRTQPVAIAAASDADFAALRMELHDLWPKMPEQVSAEALAQRLPGATVKLGAAEATAQPGRYGVAVEPATMLVVVGRQMFVIGDGAVTTSLAASGTRPADVQRYTHGGRADLIALSRAAAARAQPAYPPQVMPAPRVPSGTLVIVGGGGMPKPIVDAFVDAAGGAEAAKIVVIPTAGGRASYSDKDIPGFIKAAGVKDLRLFHAATPAEADEPAVVGAIDRATGIWFSGGRQWHLVDSYYGTKAHEAMRRLLERGGVIAGSSAGATIQGDYLVRGDPLGPTRMIAEGYERGLAFLPGVGIDQHFTQRHRFPDMELLKRTFPQIVGLGLDESTAIVVRGHVAAVIGEGTVNIYDKPDTSHLSLTAGQRYDFAAHAEATP